MSAVQNVSDATFDSMVLKSDKTVVVDFWAPWCMPCKMMSPIIDNVAVKNTGKAFFYKLNTDENSTTPNNYRIMGIPSVLFFKNGKEVKRLVGVSSPENLQSELDKLM
jgi:thioredoxin 1